jgi:hypothetical protein
VQHASTTLTDDSANLGEKEKLKLISGVQFFRPTGTSFSFYDAMGKITMDPSVWIKGTEQALKYRI